MTTSDPSLQPAQGTAAEGEVIKDLEHRGFHDLDSLSLEELQLLTERKRKQLHLEATEKKARLESEISGIETQIQELGAKKMALTEELIAVTKSLGLPVNGAERPARKPRKAKAADTEAPPDSEA